MLTHGGRRREAPMVASLVHREVSIGSGSGVVGISCGHQGMIACRMHTGNLSS